VLRCTFPGEEGPAGADVDAVDTPSAPKTELRAELSLKSRPCGGEVIDARTEFRPPGAIEAGGVRAQGYEQFQSQTSVSYGLWISVNSLKACRAKIITYLSVLHLYYRLIIAIA
jgi:hypothetical protein